MARLLYSITQMVPAKTMHFGFVKVYVLAKYDRNPGDQQCEIDMGTVETVLGSRGGKEALNLTHRTEIVDALWRLLRPMMSSLVQIGVLENGPAVFTELVED